MIFARGGGARSKPTLMPACRGKADAAEFTRRAPGSVKPTADGPSLPSQSELHTCRRRDCTHHLGRSGRRTEGSGGTRPCRSGQTRRPPEPCDRGPIEAGERAADEVFARLRPGCSHPPRPLDPPDGEVVARPNGADVFVWLPGVGSFLWAGLAAMVAAAAALFLRQSLKKGLIRTIAIAAAQ